MWEAIAQNKRRSLVLLVIMGILTLVLGAAIGATIEPRQGPIFGIGIAFIAWIIQFNAAWFGGDSILLATAGARQIQKSDAPQLWNVVEEMTIASGLGQMPRVFVIDDSSPNAFACGRHPRHASVAVTTGLLKRLNRDELQGVIAHEIGHIVNFDIRYMTLAAVMVGTIALLSEIFWRSLRYSGRRSSSSSSRENKNGGQIMLIIFAVAIVLAILAPIIARLLYFACSRQREYLADASSARFTRYPEGLAGALEKIAPGAGPLDKDSQILTPLFIINPRQAVSGGGIFSTHPSTDKRIKILRSMAGAGLADYEAAYRAIEGERASLAARASMSADAHVAKRAPYYAGPAGPPATTGPAAAAQKAVAGIATGAAVLAGGAAAWDHEAPHSRPSSLAPAAGGAAGFAAVPERGGAAPGFGAPPGYGVAAGMVPGMGGGVADHAREVTRFIDTLNGVRVLQCQCGLAIKVPANLMVPYLMCPKCGRKHPANLAPAALPTNRLGGNPSSPGGNPTWPPSGGARPTPAAWPPPSASGPRGGASSKPPVTPISPNQIPTVRPPARRP